MNTAAIRLADGQVILDSRVDLPDVLDLLIVGGGPMGTACAFRAKELGLAALVIEMDDLMKRIRDYAKDKPILPDYGGGDTMPFPAGGELVDALRFEPIDKDRMVEVWKGLYRKYSVPAKIGVELLELDPARRRRVARGGAQPLHEAKRKLSCAARGARTRTRRAPASRYPRQCSRPRTAADRRTAVRRRTRLRDRWGNVRRRSGRSPFRTRRRRARRMNRPSTGRTAAASCRKSRRRSRPSSST